MTQLHFSHLPIQLPLTHTTSAHFCYSNFRYLDDALPPMHDTLQQFIPLLSSCQVTTGLTSLVGCLIESQFATSSTHHSVIPSRSIDALATEGMRMTTRTFRPKPHATRLTLHLVTTTTLQKAIPSNYTPLPYLLLLLLLQLSLAVNVLHLNWEYGT
jgi:hypothetical protein